MGGFCAVVHAIRACETAIQPALPWFRLEIVRDDPKADISVEWKTRIVGEASGWGGIGWEMIDGRLRAKGHLQYATKLSSLSFQERAQRQHPSSVHAAAEQHQ